MVWFTQSILEYNMGVLKSMSTLSTISKDYSAVSLGPYDKEDLFCSCLLLAIEASCIVLLF